MAVILEVLNRSGQVLRHQVFNQSEVSIGRAYTNDFVVNDSYVDPFHMKVHNVADSEQFDCVDLGSINGIVQRKKNRGNIRLSSGDKVILGKTIVRVSSVEQMLAPAIPLSLWEAAADTLSRWWLVLLLAMFVVANYSFEIWLDNPLVERKANLYINVFYLFIGVVICAGFYTFLARILRHDTRFFLYFNIALCALIGNYLYGFIEPILKANLYSAMVSEVVAVLFLSLLLWLFVYACLRYASHLNKLPRTLIASILPLVIVVVSSSEVLSRVTVLVPYHPMTLR